MRESERRRFGDDAARAATRFCARAGLASGINPVFNAKATMTACVDVARRIRTHIKSLIHPRGRARVGRGDRRTHGMSQDSSKRQSPIRVHPVIHCIIPSPSIQVEVEVVVVVVIA